MVDVNYPLWFKTVMEFEREHYEFVRDVMTAAFHNNPEIEIPEMAAVKNNARNRVGEQVRAHKGLCDLEITDDLLTGKGIDDDTKGTPND